MDNDELIAIIGAYVLLAFGAVLVIGIGLLVAKRTIPGWIFLGIDLIGCIVGTILVLGHS